MDKANTKADRPRPRDAQWLACCETEYKVIHDQRLAQIRSYNVWYAFGITVAHSYFWLMLFLILDVGRPPLALTAALAGSLIVLFAYRVILTIDRDVVRLYPRIVYLELVLGYDFYRDYLRRRPHGDTERSFVEKCEAVRADSEVELWQQIAALFKEGDFPADRRITGHFKPAAIFSALLFWVVIGVLLQPYYFPFD